MNKTSVLIGLIFILVAGLATTGYALASPSEGFSQRNGDVFDDWEICRTRAFGEDGFYQVSETTFRPVIAFESLGENADLAYSLGQQIAEEYSDLTQRAEAVFRFVRDGVRYTPDIDQFDCEEFAQNADELAASLEQGGAGYGDCEDSAVLLAVMYRGAGFRSAIVIGEGHTAALVYLPDYDKATAIFRLDGELGWIWAEATGRRNPLGWAPEEFLESYLVAYEVTEEVIAPPEPPEEAKESAAAVTEPGGSGSSGGFSLPVPLFGIIIFLWIIPSLFRRRRRVR
jgi:transglutaminase-like putative cysteine protease